MNNYPSVRDNTNIILANQRRRTIRDIVLTKHPLYSVWRGLKSRCYNPNCKEYYLYGERGIKVCIEWLNNSSVFYKWAIKAGWEKGLQIDRIDVNGDYDPCNCRFVTPAVNCRNKRNNIFLEYEGKRMIMADWGKLLGISTITLQSRYNLKWSVKDILSRKVNFKKRPKIIMEEKILTIGKEPYSSFGNLTTRYFTTTNGTNGYFEPNETGITPLTQAKAWAKEHGFTKMILIGNKWNENDKEYIIEY